jgi:uncharacterized small protein (DUF1192 family)
VKQEPYLTQRDLILANIHRSLLVTTGVDDGGLGVGTDRAGGGAEGLDSQDVLFGLGISDLAEDDVLAIEPRGDSGGDEELRAVGVGASVGHGQEELLVVLELEVLIGELLAVDGATTSTVATGEVTTLEHEAGDHTVESRALVTLALLSVAEFDEVLGSLGDNIRGDLEVDAAGDGGRSVQGLVLDLEPSGSVRHSGGG